MRNTTMEGRDVVRHLKAYARDVAQAFANQAQVRARVRSARRRGDVAFDVG